MNHKFICQEIQLHFYICPQKQHHLKNQLGISKAIFTYYVLYEECVYYMC